MKGESEMNRTELCELAVKAKDNAYTPYSGFKVGAALMCRSLKQEKAISANTE